MFLLVDTSNLTIAQAPVTARDDFRVRSAHRTREAAERAWDKELRGCRRQNGPNSYLQREIVEV